MTIEQLCKVDDRPSQGVIKTDIGIIKEMIKSIPTNIKESSTTTFLEPCFGSGTFIFELIRELRRYGHSMENIQSRIHGCETFGGAVNKVKRNLSNYNFKNIHNTNFLTHDFKNMDFTVALYNPPYNGSSKEGYSRQSRNSIQLYKQFIKKSIDLNPKYLSIVIPYVWMLGDKDEETRRDLLTLGLKEIKHNSPSTFTGTNVLTVNILCERGYKGPITQQRYNPEYTKLLDKYSFTYNNPKDYIPIAYTKKDFDLYSSLCKSKNNINIKSGGTDLTRKQKDLITNKGDTLWWGGKDRYVKINPLTPDKSPYNDKYRVAYRYLIGMEPQLSRDQYVFDTEIIEPGVRVREKNRIIICDSKEEAEQVYKNLNSPLINKLVGFMCKSASLDNWIIQRLPDLRQDIKSNH